MILQGRGDGLAVYVESENVYLFPIFCGQYLFSSNFSKDHLFEDIAYLNLMDAGLFIYYPREPGHSIYFKVFDGQDIYFKKLPAPPPRINCTSLNKKKGPVSTIPK